METHELKQFETTEELASWYNQKYSEMGKGWDCPRDAALQYIAFMELPRDRRETLLDVGFGSGDFMQVVWEYVTPVGIEISTTAIDQAKLAHPTLKFEHGDIETYTSSEKFGFIASIGSIEHCIDVPKALQNIHKLLKDDGKAYMLVPNEKWIHMDQPNEVTHTDDEWLDLFIKAGFTPVKYERILDISHFLLVKSTL